ncbi:hypothetical protein O3G_MSEX000384, partial [Manduca sexta]
MLVNIKYCRTRHFVFFHFFFRYGLKRKQEPSLDNMMLNSHADGRRLAHVPQLEHAHHQPVWVERVPRAAAAAVQQLADDERAARGSV